MTISYPFVSLPEVKAFLGVPENVIKMDARYRLLLATASQQIEKATGRIFAKQVNTEFFTSRDNRNTDYDFGGVGSYDVGTSSGLLTRTKPQTFYLSGIGIDRDANFSVWYDPYAMDSTAYNADTLLSPREDYQIDFENDALVLMIGTSYRQRALKVEYTSGFAFAPHDDTKPEQDISLSAALDDTLRLAVMLQTQYLNVKTRDDNVGMGSERTVSSKDRVTSSPFLAQAGLTPEVVGMVRHLKRLRLGTA
jgi:hypothetical protein